MITEGIIAILFSVIEVITGLFPSVDMTGNVFLSQYMYPAIKTLFDIPIFGTIVEIAIWYIVFEITLFMYRNIISLLRAVRVLNADPLPQ